MSIEAMKLALEALESCDEGDWSTGHVIHPSYDQKAVTKAITALCQAIEQEPTGQLCEEAYGRGQVMWFNNPVDGSYIYTSPPQRQPLTDEQADQIIKGLRTCQHQTSKREFLKVWLRDWAAHGIKE